MTRMRMCLKAIWSDTGVLGGTKGNPSGGEDAEAAGRTGPAETLTGPSWGEGVPQSRCWCCISLPQTTKFSRLKTRWPEEEEHMIGARPTGGGRALCDDSAVGRSLASLIAMDSGRTPRG